MEENLDSLSPIPQLDGPLSPNNPHIPDQLYPLGSGSSPQLPDKPTQPKRVGYSLDKKKQLSRLCKVTLLQDYEITVSPIAQSVKIKCSVTQSVCPFVCNLFFL